MAIERTAALIHWNFFLALEEDLERLARFVDLGGNDSTYSIEIARLLLSASAETDVVLKQIVRRIDQASTASKLSDYFTPISGTLPKFFAFEATIPRYNLTLRPWQDWSNAAAPFWWSDHNKVKHGRHEHFERATLKNCLNSLAGLYSATLHLYPEEAEQGGLVQSRLFGTGPLHYQGAMLHGNGVSLCYANLRG